MRHLREFDSLIKSDQSHRPMRLDGRNAVVTGSGRGLGSTLAVALAREGANVAVHYNASSAGAEAVADEIRGLGRNAFTVQADLTSWEAIRTFAATVFDRFGRVDVLVNNVGDVAPEQMSWREITEQSIDRVLAVDIKGTMLVTHEIGGRMVEQGSGVVVNICSNVVVTGSARAPQYAASKYGVLGLTKSYAAAFAPAVRVNAAGPGFIETESTVERRDWKEGKREWVLDRTPLGRIAAPEDVSGVVLFLASDDSRHMTGNFVVCDGGFSMIGA
jgi:NAD(P)-dependent dehydrogenase (short-subunit alcohol dehydrogenase family)